VPSDRRHWPLLRDNRACSVGCVAGRRLSMGRLGSDQQADEKDRDHLAARCAGLHVGSAPRSCQEAVGACTLGIVLAMTGGLLNALSMIPARPLPPARRQAHDSISRIDQYRIAQYFPDLPDLMNVDFGPAR
jgi:hypothetical protein